MEMKTGKKGFPVKKLIPIIAGVLIYALVAVGIGQSILSRSIQNLMVMMCYNVVLAVSLNLVVGFLGELSLGHAGFYAIGAYVGCIVASAVDLPVELKFLCGAAAGGVAAAVGGFLISSSILRLKGDYLAIVTLAFGEIIRSFIKIIPGTGGTAGLTGIPGFGSRLETFTFGFALAVITIVVSSNFIHSRHGRAVKAIRDNAIAAEAAGINVKSYKIKVFTLAAFFAGMAGVLFGFNTGFIEPGNFNYNVSIEILVMVVLGGMGSITGSSIAAGIITFLPEILRDADQYRLLIYAVALILMMLLNASPKFMAFKEAINPKRLWAKRMKKAGKEGA